MKATTTTLLKSLNGLQYSVAAELKNEMARGYLEELLTFTTKNRKPLTAYEARIIRFDIQCLDCYVADAGLEADQEKDWFVTFDNIIDLVNELIQKELD